MTKKIMMWLGAGLVLVAVVVGLAGEKIGVSKEILITVLTLLSVFIGRLGFDKVREYRGKKKAKEETKEKPTTGSTNG